MNWRLILDEEYSGARNMARDEALLLCQDESTLPVLRFYNWNPACVSIGRLQKDLSFLAPDSPFDFVRRPTGGRAVLHQHEITYCAVVHENHLPRASRSVVGAYNWLSAGFIEGLKTLGIEAQLAAPHRASTSAPANCFNAAAQCDFLVDGRKLIGASQCRKHGVILQHGALLLEIDNAAWRRAIGGEMSGAIALRQAGVLAPRAEIVRALCEGMQRAHSICLEETVLSVEESEMASRLHAHKYSSPGWNARGVVPALFL